MDRKKFLATLLVLPVGVVLVHCSSSPSANADGSANDSNAPAAPPTQSGGQDLYTSSEVSAHNHTFMMDDASIAAPPAAGVSGTTSTTAGHSHSVSVSSAQLQQVAAGQSVVIASGSASGHTHVFTFVKVA
jgi:hypothetical protein